MSTDLLTSNNATSANLQSQITNAARSSVNDTNNDTDKTAADYNDFLLLLTAQLKNQDPLEPLDSTTFVSQLAEFSNVEQQVNMNTKLDNLISSLTGSDFSEASNYLGKKILADGGKIKIDAEDTQSEFSYTTSGENIESVQAIITDRLGQEIHSIPLTLAPNGNNKIWNLKDNTGAKIDSGLYNISIETNFKDNTTSSEPAQTQINVIQVQKTNNGFEFLTDTEQTISADKIHAIYAS